MSGKLTHADIQEILALVDGSSFDEFKLETAELKLSFRRGESTRYDISAPAVRDSVDKPTPFVPTAPAPSAVAANPVLPTAGAGLTDVCAPILGCFYSRSKPGAEPFVSVGSRVAPDTVICFIEVMKLMNPVPAGVSGEVVQIVAKDGEYIEFGEVILRVRKD